MVDDKGTQRDQTQLKIEPPAQPQPLRPDLASASLSTNKLRWSNKPEWWSVILTAVVVITGFITLAIFNRELGEMRAQTRILSDEAKQAANDAIVADKRLERQLTISQQQADATKNSVAAIRRQVRQDQRAWVTVAWRLGEMVAQEKRSVTIPLELENVGKTAATSVFSLFVTQVVQNGESLTFRYGKPTAGTTETIGMFWPGHPSSLIADSRVPLTRDQLTEMNAGRAYIVVYGEVIYVDIFHVVHWTRFCNFTSTATSPVTMLGAGQCVAYNGADNK